MKKSYKLQLKEFAKLGCVAVFALLYAVGGIEHKWIRRFIAPAWLGGSMFFFYRDWKVLIQMPLLMGALSLGYGADTLWAKIGRRALYGFANGFTAIPHAIFSGRWRGFIINCVLVTGVCIAFGVWNPFWTARTEEMLIGFIIGMMSMYMPKYKGEE